MRTGGLGAQGPLGVAPGAMLMVMACRVPGDTEHGVGTCHRVDVICLS